jgi:transposase-like protein
MGALLVQEANVVAHQLQDFGGVAASRAEVDRKENSHRPGLYYCNECKGQFTATVGTVFEASKIPLAAHLLNSSKMGMSAHQIHRTIGVT